MRAEATKRGEARELKYKIPRLTTIQSLILIILDREPNYLYSIWKELHDEAPQLDIGLGAVKENLRKFLRERVIRELKLVQRPKYGPAKKMYKLTHKGEAIINFYSSILTMLAIKGGKMGYPKENSQVAKAWVEKTLELKPGEELFISCESKSAQASLKTRLYGARKEYASVDPIAAESISFSPVYRDGNPYIKCYKSAQQANKGWIKTEDGTLREVTISADKDRTRKVLMLIKDGKTPKDAEEILGSLSAEEIQLFEKGVKDAKN